MLATTRAYGLDFTYPQRDAVVGKALAVYGEFAPMIPEFFLALAGEPTGALIDVGANIGAIALPFAKHRPAWKVIAIEAHAGLAELLERNAAANGLGNVQALHAAAGPEAGAVDFPDPPLDQDFNYGHTGFHMADLPTRSTRMVRLDDIAPADTRVIKVDVEGYEPEVLKGGRALIEARQAVWFVEVTMENAEAKRAVIETFLAADYQVGWFFAPFVRPTPAKGVRVDNPYLGDANIVALPRTVRCPWPVPRCVSPDEERPGAIGSYAYLKRYGFS
ncbi:FkbM family methyltransferase [Phenylobacterium sp.]|uniref:FkbM family methyltransferase n=1 Tax=Phenylobacterium sp. TaxID=1871053 RepID=UPI002F9314E5